MTLCLVSSLLQSLTLRPLVHSRIRAGRELSEKLVQSPRHYRNVPWRPPGSFCLTTTSKEELPISQSRPAYSGQFLLLASSFFYQLLIQSSSLPLTPIGPSSIPCIQSYRQGPSPPPLVWQKRCTEGQLEATQLEPRTHTSWTCPSLQESVKLWATLSHKKSSGLVSSPRNAWVIHLGDPLERKHMLPGPSLNEAGRLVLVILPWVMKFLSHDTPSFPLVLVWPLTS